MRKKTLLTASMLISAGLLLGGCAGNVPQSAKDSTLQKESTRQSEGAGSEGAGKSDPAENADSSGAKTQSYSGSKTGSESKSGSKADSGSQATESDSTTKSDLETLKVPASEKDLFTFMSGEWNLTNPVTHEDYAHIEISDNGYFKYGYTGSDERCTGVFTPDHQYMGEENVPLSFALSVSGLDKMTFPDTGYLAPDDGYDSTYAKLYYGNCDGEDYIYMEETGNGDSFMSSVLFQDPKYPDETFSLGSNSFIMHRESSKAANASAETDSFYAWIWKADDNGIWAQEMKPLTWDDENEYTGNPYTAAAFMPKEMGSKYYKYSNSVNKKLLLNEYNLELDFPRYMCRLTVNSDGSLKDIEEVDHAFYGMYDLGDLEPEISFEGMTFHFKNKFYDLSKLGAGNAIMDVFHAYGKEIIDCHVSPHMSEYYIYDRFLGELCPETIQGTNLIWLDDDFTTAIYSQGNDVIDLCGDLMYHSNYDEILDLAFIEGGKKVRCSAIKSGDSKTYEEVFEMPERLDGAMNAYCTFADSGRASDYRKFMEYAPKDAVFFVAVDPQIWTRNVFNMQEVIEEGAENDVLVVALQNDTTADVYEGDKQLTYTKYLNKERCAMYKMTVSEGMPRYTVKVTTQNQGKEKTKEWPVTEFSGKTYTHSKFFS
ncbi:hypothetical protein [Oribacterium sp. NK2B42]|uniref:hypothetical protein n=1 Tax=Oribacterium sp. NK2B42 TaxID=689781 RepID=UPI000492D672|nr:hypothetical protein [Oribacterium sp. NK2B42]